VGFRISGLRGEAAPLRQRTRDGARVGPLWSEYGTYKIVKARFWPGLSGQVLTTF